MSLVVPDATVNANDLLVIEFSGEAAIIASESSGEYMTIQVYVDGVLASTSGTDMAFTTFPTKRESNTHRVMKRVAPGEHSVFVDWDVTGGSTTFGSLDDYTLSVTRHN